MITHIETTSAGLKVKVTIVAVATRCMWYLRHLEKLSGCGSQFTLYIGNDISQ